jgi:hypothetical protein
MGGFARIFLERDFCEMGKDRRRRSILGFPHYPLILALTTSEELIGTCWIAAGWISARAFLKVVELTRV